MRSFLLTLLLALFACSTALASEQTPSQEDAPEQAAGPLAGTAWQLVKIMSMDDTTYEPRERPLYRLEFRKDGNVSILADCNRGMGSWSSPEEGRLEFGVIASTRALCLPASISEKYLAQFEWVRSYVMKDGHLFLATMADGAIIEFEPLDVPAVATVYGEKIRTDDAAEMQDLILTRLFDRYAAENGISVKEEEIDTWMASMDHALEAEGLTESHHLTPEEVEEYKKVQHDMGQSIIEHWKLNRALYKQYGARNGRKPAHLPLMIHSTRSISGITSRMIPSTPSWRRAARRPPASSKRRPGNNWVTRRPATAERPPVRTTLQRRVRAGFCHPSAKALVHILVLRLLISR
ncbi:MAG: META domain-containing protein [Gammaproteobacteria bacterium]